MGLLFRAALAVVFATAGITKLTGRSATKRAVADFGVPAPLVGVVAIGLPVAELATVMAMAHPTTARLGAAAALILLALFIVAIARLLGLGEAPECQCFGQVSSEPVGWRTIVRNIAIAVPAVVLLFIDDAGPAMWDWVADVARGEVSGSLLLLVQLLVLGAAAFVWRTNRADNVQVNAQLVALRHAMEDGPATAGTQQRVSPEISGGLPVGAPAPRFALENRDGAATSLDELLAAGRPVITFFVSPSCVPCQSLMPEVAKWEQTHGERFTFVVLSRGERSANLNKAASYEGNHFLIDPDNAVSADYEARWTPGSMVIGVDGRVASAIAYGEEGASSLVFDWLHGDPKTPVSLGSDVAIGDPLPTIEFSVPEVAGPDGAAPSATSP